MHCELAVNTWLGPGRKSAPAVQALFFCVYLHCPTRHNGLKISSLSKPASYSSCPHCRPKRAGGCVQHVVPLWPLIGLEGIFHEGKFGSSCGAIIPSILPHFAPLSSFPLRSQSSWLVMANATIAVAMANKRPAVQWKFDWQ